MHLEQSRKQTAVVWLPATNVSHRILEAYLSAKSISVRWHEYNT